LEREKKIFEKREKKRKEIKKEKRENQQVFFFLTMRDKNKNIIQER